VRRRRRPAPPPPRGSVRHREREREAGVEREREASISEREAARSHVGRAQGHSVGEGGSQTEGERSENPEVYVFVLEDGYRASLGLLGLVFFGGGPYSVPASENGFTEVGILRRPSPKIDHFLRWLP
jgi:hypothetical protein